MFQEFITSGYAVFIAGLIVGFISGVVTHHIICNNIKATGRQVDYGALTFVFLISVLYTASIIADISSEAYSTPFALHGIMGLATGYVLEARLSDILPFIKK